MQDFYHQHWHSDLHAAFQIAARRLLARTFVPCPRSGAAGILLDDSHAAAQVTWLEFGPCERLRGNGGFWRFHRRAMQSEWAKGCRCCVFRIDFTFVLLSPPLASAPFAAEEPKMSRLSTAFKMMVAIGCHIIPNTAMVSDTSNIPQNDIANHSGPYSMLRVEVTSFLYGPFLFGDHSFLPLWTPQSRASQFTWKWN